MFLYGLFFFFSDLHSLPALLVKMVELREVGMMQVMDSCKSEVFNWTELLLSSQYYLSFYIGAALNMSPRFYHKSLQRSHLKVKFSLGCVGKTSAIIICEIFHPNWNESVLTEINKVVLIDIRTRKPTPFPQWFLDKYQGKGVMENISFRLEKIERPTKTFLHCVQIMWSDTDSNAHTNFASYSKYAIDVLHLGLYLKSKPPSNQLDYRNLSALDGITEDVVRCGLKNVKINFINESVEAEIIHVHVWKQEGPEFVILCSIEKENGLCICQLSLEYFKINSSL